jgi:hypothetical protein
MIKEDFCKMCCAHHVGVKFYQKLVDCKTRCANLLLGIDWRFASTSKDRKASDNGKLRKGNTEKDSMVNKLLKDTKKN